MVICKIWDADYPWDVRVEKVCKAMTDADYEVRLVCRNKKMSPEYEWLGNLHIHRLSCPIKHEKINEAISFPFFLNPLWISKVFHIARFKKVDALLVRDLPLCLTAVLVGKALGIPIILDMAENYPEMMRDLWKWKGFKMQNILIRNPLLVKLIELLSIKLVDHIVVVVKESAERLIRLGVPPTKITIVMNTPLLDRKNSAITKGDEVVSVTEKTEFRVVYLGLLEDPRGIGTAIEAMKTVRKRAQNCKLIIIGDGNDAKNFRELTRSLNLEDVVIFMGWMQYENALRYVSACDVGLVPHYAVASWNSTIPNKLFDYMSLSKPVIVSDALPTKRIIEEEGCGLVFESRNPQSLASCIIKLYEDKTLCSELALRGREAIEKKYNWEHEAEKLMDALKRVV